MDKYIESLNKFKSICYTPKERLLLKKIALYVNGVISITDLISNLSEKNIEFVVFVLNKIANDAERELKYYIELPINSNFDSNYPYAIWVGNTSKFGVFHDELVFNGPMNFKKKYNSKEFAEINGDFSFPNGVLMKKSDWLKILCLNDDLIIDMYHVFNKKENYLIFRENVKNYLERNMVDANDLGKICFIKDNNYFSLYKVMDGKTGSFKDTILSRKI